MISTTSDVLAARAQVATVGAHTLAWSVVGHAVAVGLLVWWPRPAVDRAVRRVMTVSLSGSEGPRTGGMTEMGGATPVAPVVPTPPRPAPAVPRERPAPARSARPSAATAPPTSPAPAAPVAAAGRVPLVTGARGQGFGLSTSGGSGGPKVELDVSSFCCQAYLEGLVLTITRAWNKQHGVPGATVVGFTILRDGSVEGVAVRRTSGFAVLDSAAMRAVSQRFAPLPSEYPNATLSLRITFEYEG